MPDRIPADWPPVRLIDTPSELGKAIAAWRAAGVVGLDTESNSFYAYTDRLCLFQASAAGEDYIVDPLALGGELRAVNDLLADPSVVKIFHAAEFDLMLLEKDLGAAVRGLFDTQVAMTLLRHERTGLASLIESYYGFKPSKKEQRSDWGKRPLSPSQLAYARGDTHFLPDLYARLSRELESAGMSGAAAGEFERLEREVLPPREPDLEGWRRLKGARNLDGAAAARLRALFRWREERAREIDKPVFRVLANEALLSLATDPPRGMPELGKRRGVGFQKARRVGAEILAVLRTCEGERIDPPTQARATPEERRHRRIRRENLEALRNWRKRRAAELELPSERLLHRRHLEAIARRLPRTRAELEATISLNDWQREQLEESLLALLETLPDPEAR